MSWEMPKLDEVQITETATADFTPLPQGKYNFTLLPATSFDEARQRLNIAIAVSEGDYKGRRVFPSLPKAEGAQHWSNEVLARLASATGVNGVEGETPEGFLNRIATNGNPTFSARVYHKSYTKADGSEGTDVRMDFRSIGVAA